MSHLTLFRVQKLSWALIAAVSLSACKATPASSICVPVEVGKAAEGLSLTVGPEVVKQIGPEFFGFNLENTEFQLSLWDSKLHQVRPEVVAYLKQHFPGAVYRYPGGTTSNYHRWKQSVGVVTKRPAVKINDWIDLDRIEFGVDEFLDFVGEAGGQVWYVLNLKGDLDRLVSQETMAAEAGGLVEHIAARKVPVLRWELGNELDRFHEKWISDLYVTRAQAVMAAVKGADKQARFVSMMADFDAQEDRGIMASDYNVAVAKGLKGDGVTEYAQHLYYDGPPDGPHMMNRLEHLCRSIGNAAEAGVKDTGFWVTEHARWPQGEEGKEWQESWRKSADLGASIGMADMIIAATQLKAVKGGALHALHGTTGPWPMFHLPEGAKAYHPSVTMQTYALLRETMLPLVLQTTNRSANPAGYDAGYSARGVVMASEDKRRYSVWSINRDKAPLDVSLSMPDLAGKKISATLSAVSGASEGIHNYDKPIVGPVRQRVDLSFDDKGVARYTLAAHSVSALTFPTAGQ
ncbi:MAG: hypothetical protein Q4D91_08080 [Lautropia sp.]|nr:hypothetical protein [Lautropia sp.]